MGFNGCLPSGEHTKSNGKLSFIVDFPIKNGDFPLLCGCSPEGLVYGKIKFTEMLLKS